MGCIPSNNFFTLDDITEMVEANMRVIIYDRKIYDISHLDDFEHPAGNNLIEKNIGNDITYHMEFHSKRAKKNLTQNLIGYLI